jgi:protein TonB
MRVAGLLLSGLGHAGLVGLALIAPPWLRPHHDEPVPAIEISMISETQFAAALAALSRGSPTEAPAEAETPPEPVLPAEPPPPPPVAVEPEALPEATEALPSLAPFDPEAPLGLDAQPADPVAAAPRPAELVSDLARRAAEAVRDAPASTELAAVPPPRHRPPRMPTRRAGDPPASLGSAGAASQDSGGGAGAAGAALRADYGEAVRQAIAAAQVYPRAARERNVAGRARLFVVVARDGKLVNARLMRSSGFGALDAASLSAARNARLPAAPAQLPDQRFSFEMELVFTLDGG